MYTCKHHILWNKINCPACSVHWFCLSGVPALNSTIWTHQDNCTYWIIQFQKWLSWVICGKLKPQSDTELQCQTADLGRKHSLYNLIPYVCTSLFKLFSWMTNTFQDLPPKSVLKLIFASNFSHFFTSLCCHCLPLKPLFCPIILSTSFSGMSFDFYLSTCFHFCTYPTLVKSWTTNFVWPRIIVRAQK